MVQRGRGKRTLGEGEGREKKVVIFEKGSLAEAGEGGPGDLNRLANGIAR